jgi:hypothetical protein
MECGDWTLTKRIQIGNGYCNFTHQKHGILLQWRKGLGIGQPPHTLVNAWRNAVSTPVSLIEMGIPLNGEPHTGSPSYAERTEAKKRERTSVRFCRSLEIFYGPLEACKT